MGAVPADQTEISPLPKFEIPPSGKLVPSETPAPESGTRMLLTLVSSFHPMVRAVAALAAEEHALVESR